MAKKDKLYALLAIEGQLKNQATAATKDLRNTFDKKRHLFEEKRVTYLPNTPGAQPETESQSTLNSTIAQELKWIAALWAKALDVSYRVASGNQQARADVILDDGSVLLKDAPSTALLELEKRAAEIQELVMAIPTLDPAKGFVLDPDRGDGIYKAREVRRLRTKKTFVPLVLAAATKEHPAQVKEGWEDLPVGAVTEQEWSALVTPHTKGDILERAEELRRAVKKALQRANDTEPAGEPSCGAALFGFVFDGKRPEGPTV